MNSRVAQSHVAFLVSVTFLVHSMVGNRHRSGGNCIVFRLVIFFWSTVALHGGRLVSPQCWNNATQLPCYCIAPPANMTYILVSTGGAGSLTMTAYLEKFSPDVYHLHDPYVKRLLRL